MEATAANNPFQERPQDLQLDPKFAQIVDPNGPPPVKMMASKGIVPGATPSDLLHVLYFLSFDDNEQVAKDATKSLTDTPPNILMGAVTESTSPGVIDVLARTHIDNEQLMELFALNKSIHDFTLIHIGKMCPHLKIIEIVGKNQERLLECPGILIKGLKENSACPKSLVDVTTAFLQMAGVLPLGVEARTSGLPERINDELVEALLEDEDDFDQGMTGTDEGMEMDAEEASEKISEMSVPKKIKLAYKGNKEIRSILLRDPNKMVVKAVLNSGRITEGEAISLTKNRTIDSEILKTIAADRDLRKSYEIKLNLASNPKCPQGLSIRILRELRPGDLRKISSDRNIPGTVRATATRLINAKKTQR